MNILISSISAVLFSALFSCNNPSASKHATVDSVYARESVLAADTPVTNYPAIQQRMEKIRSALTSPLPVLLLEKPDSIQYLAQQIALGDQRFKENLFSPSTHEPFRNEILNVYNARPQEIPKGQDNKNVYRVEMYNYALDLSTIALVDIAGRRTLAVNVYPHMQPDLNPYLTSLAIQIATHSTIVTSALGYKPDDKDALMAATKTSLNRTKCERSMHLCVAPTFIKGDKALWAIVDLTDLRLVGVRWTNVGTTGPAPRISERKLSFDKIMECNCKQQKSIDKEGWKLNYIITSSDGLRISEVYFQNKLIINNAKLVDWHVSYSGPDGFGYSDAVGCPEFSQAAVIATTEPRVSELVQEGKTTGFVLEQSFQSEQWPLPCNYNYVQRYEFYKDGRFRIAAASLGRGCGNNGTYRPVSRISFAANRNNFSEWSNGSWLPWKAEQWRLQDGLTNYTPEGYQYIIRTEDGDGFFMKPGNGHFNDGGRGDNAFVYVTKLHTDIDEGESDLVTIGPCCNTDYHQGPEKFIEPRPENIENTQLVIWYVAQMKNDDTRGREYCWAESYLENGVYKTHAYPCFSGPMFVPCKTSGK